MSDSSHPIQVVADRTGLSAHVIRIWEKRYGAVTPSRTETNRRLYSGDEIERLKLLRRLAENGHGIGHVAKLPTEKLTKLVADLEPSDHRGDVRGDSAASVAGLVDRAISAIKALDERGWEEVLKNAELQLGARGVLQLLIAPLATMIGDSWRKGELTAAHEHFATDLIRLFLSRAARPFAGSENAPLLMVATPAGQIHELGALLAAASAANVGWRVTYVGPSLPAADLAGAVRQKNARALALSIVYPEDDDKLGAELDRLRALLPDTVIIAGGRALPGYAAALERIAAIQTSTLSEFEAVLDRLRKRPEK